MCKVRTGLTHLAQPLTKDGGGERGPILQLPLLGHHMMA